MTGRFETIQSEPACTASINTCALPETQQCCYSCCGVPVGNNNIHPQLTNMLVQQVTTDQATSTQGPVGTSHALQLLIDDLGLSTCSTPPAKHHVSAPRRAAEVSCHASQGQDQHFDEHKELERAFASLMQKCRNLPAEYIRTKILPLLQRMNKMASAELRRMRRAQRQCEWHCSRLSSLSEWSTQQARLLRGGL